MPVNSQPATPIFRIRTIEEWRADEASMAPSSLQWVVPDVGWPRAKAAATRWSLARIGPQRGAISMVGQSGRLIGGPQLTREDASRLVRSIRQFDGAPGGAISETIPLAGSGICPPGCRGRHFGVRLQRPIQWRSGDDLEVAYLSFTHRSPNLVTALVAARVLDGSLLACRLRRLFELEREAIAA